MKDLGYTTVFVGDIVHIIQCQFIQVQVRSSNTTCYNKVLISLNNKTYFIILKWWIRTLNSLFIQSKTIGSSLKYPGKLFDINFKCKKLEYQ
jgi:hypothetical protein